MRAALGLLLLAGCGSDAKTFAYDRAAAVCQWHERCDTLKVAGFDDEAGCEDALRTAADELASAGELNCPQLDSAAAAACLAVWDDAVCGETLDLSPCDGVCPGS